MQKLREMWIFGDQGCPERGDITNAIEENYKIQAHSWHEEEQDLDVFTAAFLLSNTSNFHQSKCFFPMFGCRKQMVFSSISSTPFQTNLHSQIFEDIKQFSFDFFNVISPFTVPSSKHCGAFSFFFFFLPYFTSSVYNILNQRDWILGYWRSVFFQIHTLEEVQKKEKICNLCFIIGWSTCQGRILDCFIQ